MGTVRWPFKPRVWRWGRGWWLWLRERALDDLQTRQMKANRAEIKKKVAVAASTA